MAWLFCARGKQREEQVCTHTHLSFSLSCAYRERHASARTRVSACVYRARFTHFEAIESDRGQGGRERDEEAGDRRYRATAAVDIRIRHTTATRTQIDHRDR